MLRDTRVWVLPLCDVCGEVCSGKSWTNCHECHAVVHTGRPCSSGAGVGSWLCPACDHAHYLETQRTLSQLDHELDAQAAQAGNGSI